MNYQKLFSNEYTKVGLLLAITLAIFFYQPIIHSRTLVPLDILKEFDLTFKQANSLSKNYLLSDIVDQFYPNYSFLQKSFSQGEFPFWNPQIVTGIPFFADSQTGIFELTHLVSYIFQTSPLVFPLVSALLLLFILGLSFYIYLRNLKFDSLVALFGSVTLMFSGTMIVWVNYPLVAAFVWLPLILLCLDKIVVDRNLKFLPLLSVTIGLSLFAGYPQIAFLNLLVAGLYFLGKGKKYGQLKMKTVTAVILFVLLGIAVSAIQIGPSWDFITKSDSYEVGRGYFAQDNVLNVVNDQARHLKQTIHNGIDKIRQYGVLVFNPNYYGSPLNRNYRPPENNFYANYSEVTIYSGILTILLALISVIWVKKNKAIIFWLTTTIVCFALSADLPFIGLLKYLPLINKISLGRFRPLLIFSLVLLATYGLQQIVRSLKSIHLKKILTIILIIISFADLFYYFHNYNLGNDISTDFITNNKAVQFLQANTNYERIIGLGPVNQGFRSPLVPNVSTLVGLYDVRGYNPIVGKEYINFADTYLTRRGSFILADAIFDEQAIDIMSIKYILCPREGCMIIKKTEDWIQEYADDNSIIMRNPHFLPRAYVAYNYIDDQNKPLAEILKSNTLNLYSQIVVNNSSGMTGFSQQPQHLIDAAEITDYSNNTVKIKSKSKQAGILVLTDAYDQGWKVTVNGKEQKVLKVNGIFRGVLVPQGESQIIFHYLPANFYLYLTTSIVSLGLLLLSAVLLANNKRRRRTLILLSQRIRLKR